MSRRTPAGLRDSVLLPDWMLDTTSFNGFDVAASELRVGDLSDTLDRIAAMIERIPAHRFGTPEEIAAAVCYLASPAAAYVPGQTLLLDGGLTAY